MLVHWVGVTTLVAVKGFALRACVHVCVCSMQCILQWCFCVFMCNVCISSADFILILSISYRKDLKFKINICGPITNLPTHSTGKYCMYVGTSANTVAVLF